VLVTHDRYMLDRVCTSVLGLDGRGGAERFADYSQWEAWQRRPQQEAKSASPAGEANPAPKKKLSYLEAREFAGIEDRVTAAEEQVAREREVVEDPRWPPTPCGCKKPCMPWSRRRLYALDELYARWAELEAKERDKLLSAVPATPGYGLGNNFSRAGKAQLVNRHPGLGVGVQRVQAGGPVILHCAQIIEQRYPAVLVGKLRDR
jgi:hypothetical protein